jgi:hypothetical protein
VARQLDGDGPLPSAGEFGVAGARAQRPAQVALGPREQAVTHLAVGGQPDPVAAAAERPGHRRDHADLGRAPVHQECLGGGRSTLVRVIGGEGELAAQRGENLVRGDHLGPLPAVLRVKRHLLDEAQLIPVVETEPEQWRGLVIVQVSHQHGVDLDRGQASLGGGGQPVEHVGQPVPARELAERLGPHRVERHVDPVKPRLMQRTGAALEPDGVRRQGDLRARAQCRRPGDDADQAAPQQRLAAGEPDLANAEPLNRHADKPHHLVVGEQLGGRQPVEPFGRHAVRASQIAPVGERYAQISRDPPKRIRQHIASLCVTAKTRWYSSDQDLLAVHHPVGPFGPDTYDQAPVTDHRRAVVVPVRVLPLYRAVQVN